MEDYCGFRIETPDGLVWMPGDSRLMEEQLTYEHPDLILMDISDGSWHIGLDGVKKLTDVYDDSVLIPIHWGCVRSDWKEFNGDPAVVRDMIVHPERFKEVPCGEAVRLARL
jgi:L-ascorbate metabolism protein UlaG (beta-lactamase superfamily)